MNTTHVLVPEVVWKRDGDTVGVSMPDETQLQKILERILRQLKKKYGENGVEVGWPEKAEEVLVAAETSTRFQQLLGLAERVGDKNLSDDEILTLINAKTGQAFASLNAFIEHASNQSFSRAPDAVLSDIV